jgi:predicted ATPase/tRNA A-37 threonylcarbamoyl transferase component Bud32
MGSSTDVLGDRFELGAHIGSGSAADVYRARDHKHGVDVAIKLARQRIDPEVARVRFEREAAVLSVLSSPHVVRLLGAGASGGRPYLVLELLIGQTFEAELASGSLPPAEVVRRLAQVAAALELAHGLGIVHRDLKPANLFLHAGRGAPVVKVLDFGLARDVTDGVRPDGVVGTPMYMAPEQVRAQATRIGPASDGWALAMLALTLITGEPYWTPGTIAEVMAQIEGTPMYAPSTRWPWLPAAFDAWFARATHRVPEKRFRSVGDAVSALRTSLADLAATGSVRRIAVSELGGASTMIGTPTPTVVKAKLPGQRPLIGRTLERAEIASHLAPGALVVLVGPSGVGKSRLAEAVAAEAGERFTDGAWVVPCGGLADGAAIPDAIGHALGLVPDATRAAIDQVADALAPRRALLVIDSIERLEGAADILVELQGRCPGVSWLVTTRVAPGAAGEIRLVVEPLDGPSPSVSAEEAASYPAIALFVSRARAVDPRFALDDDNVAAVAAICRLVDGLPLGIELAAAQVASRGVADIRAELESAGPGDEPVRAAVSWSYRLLDAEQQALLRHLAVFPAGLPFADLRDGFGHVGEPVSAVMRFLESGLVASSSDDPPRLTMLDGVRELCRRDARDRGEDQAIWYAAIAHLAGVAARAEAGMRGPEQERWLQVLDAEHDNLRAAIGHALGAVPAGALALAGRLAWYWYVRGHYHEGSSLLESALAVAAREPGPDRLRALAGAGRLALLECRYQRAADLLGEARTLAAALAEPRGEAEAAQLLGSIARERGDYAAARDLHGQSLALWIAQGDRREAARARNYLVFVGWIGAASGRPPPELAAWWQGEAERELRAVGDVEGTVWALLNRGAIHHHGGQPELARAALEAAFAEAASARFQEGIAWSLELMARGSFDRGELLQARAQLHASLRVQRRLGDLWRCASVLEALAGVLVADGRPARGAVYLGAADALRDRIGAPTPACERAHRAACEQRGVAAIGAAFAAGVTRGRRTPLDEVVAMSAELF